MSYTIKVDGRRFTWNGASRLTYVRRSFPRGWKPAPYESATHVIHMWLPTALAPFKATIRKVGRPCPR